MQFGIWHLAFDTTGSRLTDLSLVWKDSKPNYFGLTFQALSTADDISVMTAM